MKCPGCRSDLNTRDATLLPGLGRMRAITCAFCSGFVSLPEGAGPPGLLGACCSCGSPTKADPSEESAECEPCIQAGSLDATDRRPQEESAQRIEREIFKVYTPLDRSEAAGYFDGVLETLASAAGRERSSVRLAPVQGLGFQIVTIPGGTILSGREMLSGLEDEAMLAFVLARELGHQEGGRVIRRFRDRRVPRTLTTGLDWGLGLLTRGTISLLRGDAEVVREVARLGYGPRHEAQADEWAIRLLIKAGYDAAASVRYLRLLENRHLESRGALAAFVDMHPARSQRRCLAETLVAIHRGASVARRSNRDPYRRAAASLLREELPAQPGRRTAVAHPVEG